MALQHRRLRQSEPEDEVFVFRWWADLQFFIIALGRLRRIAKLAADVPSTSSDLNAALKKLDKLLQILGKIRNIGEHIDEYTVDAPRRHYSDVCRHQLQVGTWDGTVFYWLGYELNVDDALRATEELCEAVKEEAATFVNSDKGKA